ncbi:MAG: cytochrome C oxidase subunit IV family protein [Pirellulales bacterium]
MAEHTPHDPAHHHGAEEVAHGPIVHREDLRVDHQFTHPEGHHGGLAKYVYVFIALCILTGASFFTYSEYWPWREDPQVGWAFMMAVSCTKAMLVILFFMHVKYEANWKYVLTIPAGMMSIFLLLMLVPDVGLRQNWYSEERRLYAAEPLPEVVAEHESEQQDGDKTTDQAEQD